MLMRVSRLQAEENRRTVVKSAARLFRERGFDGVGVNELMGAAGLTQGGFYKQFASKSALVAEASECAMDEALTELAAVAQKHPQSAFTKVIHAYLSKRHRDNPGQGCAFAALGADAARQGDDLLEAFESGFKAHLEVIAEAMESEASPANESDPIAAFSTMVGALVLSRLTKSEALSTRILQVAARSLLSCPGRTSAASDRLPGSAPAAKKSGSRRL
jgi:TetR/AcrR family transcriptional repressor of nem operon